MSDKEALAQVIDEAEPQPQEPLEQPQYPWRFRARFGYCLSKVPCKAKITGSTIHIRPENVDKFSELVGKQGLGNDPLSQYIIKWLRTNPGEWIRYEH